MSFEPRGKVKVLLEAMRTQPLKVVWPARDVAETMEVARGNLPAYLQAVITRGLLHRKLEGGESFFSLQPFETQQARPGPAPANLVVPKFGENWTPPKMVAPRGDNQPPRQRLPMPLHQVIAPPPPPSAPDEGEEELGGAIVAQNARVNTMLADRLEKASAPAAAPEPEVEPETEGEEAVDFNAALWADGDLMLYGLVELEGGGHRLDAEHVPALKRLLAGVAG